MLDIDVQRKIVRAVEKKITKDKGEEVCILSANFNNEARILEVMCYYANGNENFIEEIPYEELSYEE